MKLLLDQGLPRSTVNYLAAAGITAEHVGELGMSQATDEAILDAARERDAVLVTRDGDFHKILSVSGAAAPSVVRVRIEGLKAEGLSRLLAQVIANAHQELANGAAVSVTESRIRVRSLPIGK